MSLSLRLAVVPPRSMFPLHKITRQTCRKVPTGGLTAVAVQTSSKPSGREIKPGKQKAFAPSVLAPVQAPVAGGDPAAPCRGGRGGVGGNGWAPIASAAHVRAGLVFRLGPQAPGGMRPHSVLQRCDGYGGASSSWGLPPPSNSKQDSNESRHAKERSLAHTAQTNTGNWQSASGKHLAWAGRQPRSSLKVVQSKCP